jgi:RNA recognition motif-containing protein
VTSRSKQFAFVDFNTAEAAEICIKAWNNASMKKHPNRLSVTKYEAAHQKMTKAERDNSKAKSDFTNLYVDKLPYAF